MSVMAASESATDIVSAPKTRGGRPDGRSLADYIAGDLGRRIVRGEFQEDSLLPIESELAQVYAAGRNAVREAVRTLVSKGMVRPGRRAGTMVLPKERWNLLDPDVMAWSLTSAATRKELIDQLTVLRAIIEPEVAAIAAASATTTEVLRIFEAFEAMEERAHDEAEAIAADVHFHRMVFSATHNLLLMNFARAIFLLMRANFETSIKADNAFIRNLEDHRKIADAIHARDPDAARQATRVLLHHNELDLAKMADTTTAETGSAQVHY
jgi:DNA-binding FadR family transcriptional regulator